MPWKQFPSGKHTRAPNAQGLALARLGWAHNGDRHRLSLGSRWHRSDGESFSFFWWGRIVEINHDWIDEFRHNDRISSPIPSTQISQAGIEHSSFTRSSRQSSTNATHTIPVCGAF